MENEKDKLDSDALVKAGAFSLIGGAASSGIAWLIDKARGNPERLEELGIIIWDWERALNKDPELIFNFLDPNIQKTFFNNDNSEKLVEDYKLALENYKAEKQNILNQRLFAKCAVVAGVAVCGFALYQHFHEKHEQKNQPSPNNLIASNDLVHQDFNSFDKDTYQAKK